METVNHECYVSLEVAKQLKEAGFDWEGTSYYQHGVFYPYSIDRERLVITNKSSAPDYMEQYSAPTLDVAQRWLREVKGYYVDVTFRNLSLDYRPRIYKIVKCTSHIIYLGDIISLYESALEAGIKKALEIILEKGE